MSENCRDCRLWETSQTGNGLYSCNKMMGIGSSKPDVMFVGNWPGDDELKCGAPLTGLMGQLLKRCATSVGITQEQSYYTYLCKCKPSFDNPPGNIEIRECFKYLLDEIRTVKPKVIVALGAKALSAFGIKGVITQVHGQETEYKVDNPEGGEFTVKVIPIYDPAYVNNFIDQSRQKKEFSQDLGKVFRIVSGVVAAPAIPTNYRVAKTIEDVKEICSHLQGAEWVSYDCETTGLNPATDKILIVSLSDGPGKGYVIPYLYPGIFNAQEQKIVKQEIGNILGGQGKKIMQNGKFDIQFLFADGIPIKIFAFDTMLAHYLLDENSKHGLDAIVPTYTDMGSYKEDISQYFKGKIKVLVDGVKKELNNEGKEVYIDNLGNEISFTKAHRVATILDCPYDQFTLYAAQDADATFRLYKAFWPLLENEGLLKLLVQIVTPLSYVLAKMEFEGIKGDLNYVQTTSEQFKKELGTLKELISNSLQVKRYLEKYNNGKKVTKTGIKKAGFTDHENILSYLKNRKILTENNLVYKNFEGVDAEFKSNFPATDEQYEKLDELLYDSSGEFNINSSVQKGKLLFDIMGLIPVKINKPTAKKKALGDKQGTPSTDAEALELLLAENKIKLIEDIMSYAKVKKFQEYMLSYKEILLGSHDGRIHTSYMQHRTKTGRLSSTKPNLQTIPKHDEKKAKLVRTTFIAKEGYSLIEADYSQIEFRLWGHCSGDKALLDSLNDGKADIHYQIASRVFRIPVQRVTKEQRFTAKSVVYGMMYGMGDFSLANQYNMDEDEVKRFKSSFFSAFPDAANYMEKNVALMEKQGYVQNWAGRRRRSTDIYSKLKDLKETAQRQARNSPLQAGVADLVSVAMIKAFRMLQPYGDDAKMLLQIHDSIVYEVKDSILVELLPKIQYEMENAVPLKCKAAVEVEIGKTLGDMKKVRINSAKLEILKEVKELDGKKEEIWGNYGSV